MAERAVWVVREGLTKGEGRYLGAHWDEEQCDAYRYSRRREAKVDAGLTGGRVVRLIRGAEAKRRAEARGRAQGLREAAADFAESASERWAREEVADRLEEMAARVEGGDRG